MAIAPADSSHDRPPSLSDDCLGGVSDAVLHVMSILLCVDSYLAPGLYNLLHTGTHVIGILVGI